MDRTLEVRTPESIAFSYELAGVGSRFLALAVDLTIQVAAVLLLIWGLFAADLAWDVYDDRFAAAIVSCTISPSRSSSPSCS